jgi:hypothetical protein
MGRINRQIAIGLQLSLKDFILVLFLALVKCLLMIRVFKILFQWMIYLLLIFSTLLRSFAIFVECIRFIFEQEIFTVLNLILEEKMIGIVLELSSLATANLIVIAHYYYHGFIQSMHK